MKITRKNAQKIGSAMNKLYRKCWEKTLSNYKGYFQNKEVEDRSAMVTLTNASFECLSGVLVKQIKELAHD